MATSMVSVCRQALAEEEALPCLNVFVNLACRAEDKLFSGRKRSACHTDIQAIKARFASYVFCIFLEKTSQTLLGFLCGTVILLLQ